MKYLLVLALCLQMSCLVFGRQRSCECSDCTGSLELGIVLDSSASIADKDFNVSKEFIINFLEAFDIGDDSVRVSLISYGRDVHEGDAFYLNTYTSERALFRAILNVPHHHQDYTNTGGAIEFMRKHQLNVENCRPGVGRVGIVITDGNSQKRYFTADQAKLARESGILMFSVGVGHDISETELLNIAGDKARVNRAQSYDKLSDITGSLARETCSQAKLQFVRSRREL